MRDLYLKNVNIAVTDGGHFTPDEETEWSIKPHRAGFCKLYYVTKGACEITIEGRTYEGRPGALFFIPAGALHSYRIIERPFAKYWMHLAMTPEGNFLSSGDMPYLVYPKDRAVSDAFRRFAKAFNGESVAELLTVRASAFTALACFFGAVLPHGEAFAAPSGPLGEVLRVMEADLASNPSNERLAAICHMHPTYFIRYFKAEIGYTPKAYLTKLRMARARTLLRDGRLSVAEIAERLGFYDGMYFSKVFKKYYSVTPGEYRRLYGD